MSANTVTFAQNRSIPETAVRFDAWFETTDTRDFRGVTSGPTNHRHGGPLTANADAGSANRPLHGERYVENWVI